VIDELYSAKLLKLAANLPHLGRLTDPQGSSLKVAKLCGSTVVVDLDLEDGVVSRFAQDVKACALGQASAAVLGAHVVGASLSELELAKDQFRAMLKDGGSPPNGRFSDLSMLALVKDYPARHASTLLAFEAAVDAARQATTRTSRAGAA
jgi:NifU-like protein involved in Fe-S cluster formation